jgi:transglutaminase superfamily protein
VAPAGLTEFRADIIISDSGIPDEVMPSAQQHPIDELPDDTLIYLLGSRYCDTQKLSEFAWQQFVATAPGWERVQAICDFGHNHITFGYANARDDRTASDGLRERVGVCRDFTQLAITLCRCMNIPARYCTGYLGDIGVEPDPAPMDFSAWFEVYLGNRWFTFDARHNHPRIGRVVIARGRDAADVAISTSFGSAKLEKFKIIHPRGCVQPSNGRPFHELSVNNHSCLEIGPAGERFPERATISHQSAFRKEEFDRSSKIGRWAPLRGGTLNRRSVPWLSTSPSRPATFAA